MAAADLGALAERLAAATGPDRALDFLIEEATGLRLIPFPWRMDDGEWVTTIGGQLFEVTRNNAGGCSADYYLRRYTEHLDDAVTLFQSALPGWRGAISFGTPEDRCGAVLYPTQDMTRAVSVVAPAPALALCLAFVRARMAMEAGDGR